MKSLSRFILIAFFLIGNLMGCKSSQKFSGFSYDPAGVTETTTKQLNPQYKRTIGFIDEGIWASNEFPGGRLNNFFKKNDTLYEAVIRPEIAPVNDSPWYAFKAWSKKDTTVWIALSYRHGQPRYIPKLSHDRSGWTRIKPQNYRVDEKDSTAFLRLHLSPQPLYISAQELITQNWFDQWADSLARKSFITQDTAGFSHEHRPIRRIKIDAVPKGQKRGVVIVTGRLHPPEVTGNLACYAFLEEVASNTILARRFRNKFEVIAYPFANPDGVQDGHWRTNGGGVDLNRDWKNFNQPETRAIRNDLLKQLKNNPKTTVYYGLDFHSTNENIFYPINRDIKTFPDDFTYGWVDSVKTDFPGVKFAVEPFDASAPIAKNWIWRTFGADAVTYEVDDQANRKKLKAIARKSARLVMKGLLRAMEKNNL